MPARNRSAATLVSSTVQLRRIRPNLLPENRPSTSPPRSRARMRFADFGDHGVRDIEAEGVVDARQMIDADQHEGAGRAEARGLLDRFGERGDQMGAIEFAGQRIVPRQLQQLLVAGVAFIVDADDALRARRLAVGAGEPAAGLLDPDHGRGGRGPHAIFDPVGDAFAAARRRGLAKRVGPDRTRTGSISLANSAPLASASSGNVGKDRGRVVAPGDGIGGEVPDESRLPERSEDAGGLRDSWHQGRLDFGTAGDSGRPRIVAISESDARQSS